MQAIVQYTVTRPLLTMMSIKGECLLLDIVHSHLQYMNGDSRIPESTLSIKEPEQQGIQIFVLKLQMVMKMLCRSGTYSEDKKFLNKALMRSRPCLTLRRLRERLPCVFTVSFLTSMSSILFKVSYIFDASTRSRTWNCQTSILDPMRHFRLERNREK